MDEQHLNTALWSTCVAISVTLLTYCVYSHIKADSPTVTHKLLVAASAVFVLKTITPLVYGLVLWLPPQPRYVGVFLFLNGPHVMLFYLYEVRLYIFVTKQFPEAVVRGVRIFMYCLIGLFACVSVVLTSLAVIYAKNTPSGGYSTDGPGFFQVKVVNYSVELTICFFILLGTFVSTYQRIIQNRAANLHGSSFLYMVILTSDTTMFAIVFLIVIYKSATSFDVNIGVLPYGNIGFQHLIDAIQFILMVVNLQIPAVIYRSATSGKSTSRSRTGPSSKGQTDSSGVRGYNVGPQIPLDELSNAEKNMGSNDSVSVRTTTQLLRTPSFSYGKVDQNPKVDDKLGYSPTKQLQLFTYNQAKSDLLEGGGGGVLGGYNAGMPVYTDVLSAQTPSQTSPQRTSPYPYNQGYTQPTGQPLAAGPNYTVNGSIQYMQQPSYPNNAQRAHGWA
ncbi:hypothetical protein BJ742DRAFT_512290 [Cladochytrium replicatum]|nr:hypothetical protein BJ742DRAFT_512290 [Cladochytrium replicatum]